MFFPTLGFCIRSTLKSSNSFSVRKGFQNLISNIDFIYLRFVSSMLLQVDFSFLRISKRVFQIDFNIKSKHRFDRTTNSSSENRTNLDFNSKIN